LHDPQVPCSSASEARQHDQPAQAGAIRANAGALGLREMRGYEAFRFVGHELMNDAAPPMLREFFAALDERFGSVQSARPL
ncbi:hypothetical protein, partial [Streptomyces scabiei]|uniref:hypothetical protein n=1 Tax=Streptomyces scabiei TaxID=1930 RepID=UPI0029BF7709